ncbi:hypothetical protein BC834DRAFT_145015 [Gloeopeniophorella convolvens]|nr:hypothetical protein BC834DRAFT_145015 [Gloeopeniophorella convolvens]
MSALDAPSSIDKEALKWTLTELDEDHEIEDYVARIPGFFDSVVPNAPGTMLDLMAPTKVTSTHDAVLAVRLHSLLRTCLPGTTTLEPHKRIARLHACLTALWYYARGYCVAESPEQRKMPPYFRMRFADPNDTNTLDSDSDVHTRLAARCIHALIASRLAKDVPARTEFPKATEGETQFMKKVLGPLWTIDLFFMFGIKDQGATQLANLVALLEDARRCIDPGAFPTGVLKREVPETIEILVRSILENLPKDAPSDPPSRTDPVLAYTRRIVEQFFSLYSWLTALPHFEAVTESSDMKALVDQLRLILAVLPPQEIGTPPVIYESEFHQTDGHPTRPTTQGSHRVEEGEPHISAPTSLPPMPEPIHYAQLDNALMSMPSPQSYPYAAYNPRATWTSTGSQDDLAE